MLVMTVEADVDPLLPLLEEVVVVGLGHSCVRGGVDSILPLPYVLTYSGLHSVRVQQCRGWE